MKILTAHQPVYLPWLGLFHKLALADEYVWYDDVQYQTKDWNNRNRIKTSTGPLWLSVPVQRTNHFSIKVGDILIDNTQPWARKHWRSIEHAYAKTLYFSQYADDVRSLYEKSWTRLADLNWEVLKFFMTAFDIVLPVGRLSNLAASGDKSGRVLDMCIELGADAYIFGAEGRNYADIDAFHRAGVTPFFQDYAHPVYPQLSKPFVSHMSALDLLFNCGPESRGILLSGNIGRDEIRHAESLRSHV